MLMRSSEIQPEYDLQACVEMMRGGSKSFFAASKLLPLRMRAAAIALYAFCRVADDLVDNGESSELALQELKYRIDLIYKGRPQSMVEDQALALLVHQYELPRTMLDALIDGFEWDANGKRYETIEDLHGYGARVAGTVGALMCWMMGPKNETTLARACELGVAMQLTNIARDVGEDARNGRLYLPLAWMREEGIDPDAWLKQPHFSEAIQKVIARLLNEADQLYKKATDGIAQLPRDCRSAILAARLIYAEIGHQLRRDGYDSINHRTVVSKARKLALVGQSQIQATWIKSSATPSEPLEAIKYLVGDCQKSERPLPYLPDGFPNRTVGQRIDWMFEMFERIESQRKGIGFH
jgi:phytoene synthase